MPTQRYNHDNYDEPLFCDEHQIAHRKDLCPRCLDESEEDVTEVCEDHGIEQIDGFCDECEAEIKADMLHDMIKDGEA